MAAVVAREHGEWHTAAATRPNQASRVAGTRQRSKSMTAEAHDDIRARQLHMTLQGCDYSTRTMSR